MGESRCMRCIVEGQPKKKWTCACGAGYWDAVKQKFIYGSQVRNGKELTRADYEGHLQKCSRCRKRAEEDDLILPTIEPPWSGGNYGPDARAWEDLSSESEALKKPSDRVKTFFLPTDGIDADVLETYIVERLDSRGLVTMGTHKV